MVFATGCFSNKDYEVRIDYAKVSGSLKNGYEIYFTTSTTFVGNERPSYLGYHELKVFVDESTRSYITRQSNVYTIETQHVLYNDAYLEKAVRMIEEQINIAA